MAGGCHALERADRFGSAPLGSPNHLDRGWVLSSCQEGRAQRRPSLHLSEIRSQNDPTFP